MTINEIMNKLESINYGVLDKNNNNIMDDEASEKKFNKIYRLLSPEDLLDKGYGVCWDQVELERKLFQDSNIDCETYFIYIDDKNYLPSHTFLVYEEDNHYYWFEHSWYDQKGIHKYNSKNELINDVKKKFLLSRSNELDVNKYETYIYKYKKPKYNITCDEFYDFIYKQEIVYNYELKKSTKKDIDRLMYYKLKSIVDYTSDLSSYEMNKINNYINETVPKQISNYKNIIYNNKIIGSILITINKNNILLDEIFLEKEYRNKGIGTSIITDLINDTKKDIYLWVYKNNEALNLYKKLGFKVIEETQTRYKMIYK